MTGCFDLYYKEHWVGRVIRYEDVLLWESSSVQSAPTGVYRPRGSALVDMAADDGHIAKVLAGWCVGTRWQDLSMSAICTREAGK